MRQIDVAIIGGSVAGAACARELARLGVEAIAFERDRFPREKVCGGFLSPGAVDVLDQLGVLESVRRAGAVEVRSARVRLMDRELAFPFPRAGLGISRKELDAVLAAHAAVEFSAVRSFCKTEEGFRLRLVDAEIRARVLVDAAGKLSRFTRLRPANEFAVHYYEPESRGDILDFWFFREGYGGVVSIEGGRTNGCFLIRKENLATFIRRPGCRITGPLSYRALSQDLISIGDAAGMIDPFCGEGMHHALDTARLAASAIASGLEHGWPYARMRRHYAIARWRRWAPPRAAARTLRGLLPHRSGWSPSFVPAAERLIPAILDQLWRLNAS